MASRLLAGAIGAVAMAGFSAGQSVPTLPPNNGSGGVYLDLTPATGALRLTQFSSYYTSTAGTPVDVQVWTRSGSYVGFQGNAAGWSLYATVTTTSAGQTVESAPVALATPLLLPSGQTTGICFQATTAGGGIRYQGTGTVATTTFANPSITLFSAHANTGAVAFTGTTNTPRAFSGTVFYTPDNVSALGACCFNDGSCQFVSYTSCQTMSGAYQSEGITCSPNNPCPQPASNDLCASAITVTTATTNITGDNRIATADVDPGACTTATAGNFGVWYTFTPAVDGTVVFDETSSQDVACGLWAVAGAGNPAVDCPTFTGANGLCLAAETWATKFVAGATYYTQIGAQALPPTGPFSANLTWLTTAPANVGSPGTELEFAL